MFSYGQVSASHSSPVNSFSAAPVQYSFLWEITAKLTHKKWEGLRMAAEEKKECEVGGEQVGTIGKRGGKSMPEVRASLDVCGQAVPGEGR